MQHDPELIELTCIFQTRTNSALDSLKYTSHQNYINKLVEKNLFGLDKFIVCFLHNFFFNRHILTKGESNTDFN